MSKVGKKMRGENEQQPLAIAFYIFENWLFFKNEKIKKNSFIYSVEANNKKK